jgi:hypothetical protein
VAGERLVERGEECLVGAGQDLAVAVGEPTALCRILILERDYRPGRTTIILVREPVGY